jgi:RHS repeat-associated protein
MDAGTWFLRTATTSPRFYSISYGTDLFVAVGEDSSMSGAGAMMISADGGSWLPMTGLGVPRLRAATFGAIDFRPVHVVAGDSKTLLYSGNGVAWTQGTLPVDIAPRGASYGCLSMMCDLGAYVLVGADGILSSGDGINWVERKPATPAQSSTLFKYLNAVIFDGTYFIAVGGVLTGPDAYRGRILMSADGASWTDISPNPPVLCDLTSVAYGNGVWLAVGGALSGSYETNTVLRSTDRVTWTPLPGVLPDKYNKVTALAFNGSEFVLSKDTDSLCTSRDGWTWTKVALPTGVISGFSGRSFACAQNTVVGVGLGGSTSVGIIQSSDVLRTRRGGRRDHPFTFYDSDDRPPTRIGLPVYGVNTAVLNLALDGTLFYMKTLGVPVNFRVVFNAHPEAEAAMFGKGWGCNYQGSLAFNTSTARLMVGGGKTLVFLAPASLTNASPSTPITLVPPLGVADQLTCYGDYWLLRAKQQRTFRFDRSTSGNIAYLTYLEDKNGNRITLDVNLASGNITAIRDGTDRVIQFNYAGPYCTEIRLPDGRYVACNYIGDKLVLMRDLNGYVAYYSYDSDGFLIGMTVEGSSMSFNYAPRPGVTNEDKCLVGVTDPVNGLTRYEFQTNSSCKVKRTSAKGLVTLLSAADGNTAGVTDPLNNVRSITYVNGLPSAFVNANKRTSSFAYDSRGNLTNAVEPTPLGTTKYTYNADDFLTSRTDALSNRWSYAYDPHGNLTTVTTPLTNLTQMAYNSYGQLLSVTAPGGRTTTFSNDFYGNITQVIDPLGYVTAFTFDRYGLRCTNIVDARGSQKNLEYDGDDRLARITYLLPGGGTRSVVYGYNSFGLTSANDELGYMSSFERNLLGFITRATDPLGNSSLYEYDLDNNRVKETDPLGRVVGSAYDTARRLIATTNALGNVLSRGYDAEGNLTSLTNYRGKTTLFTYENANLLKTVKYPGASTTLSYTRDKLGRVTKLLNNRGNDVNSVYDKDGRLVEKRYGSTLFASYVYDGVGNQTAVTDAGGTTAYTYNTRNELTGITYPDGKQVSFSYDPMGNLAQVVYPDGTTVKYTYDSLNRTAPPSSLGPNPDIQPETPNRVICATWQGGSVGLSYDAAARLTRLSRTNGTISDYTYDARGKTTSLVHLTGSNVLARLVCAYDAAGNCIGENNQGVLDPPVPTPLASATYNDGDQLAAWNGKPYTYDADGNLVTVGSNEQTASYDAENRLLSLTRAGATTTFTYNGNGDRVSALSGGKTTRYYYDYQGRLLCEADGSGTITANNIYAGSRLVGRGTSASGYHYYHADRLGSTLVLTDAAGNATVRYGYAPYGAKSVQGSEVGNPFTFVGAHGVMDEGMAMFFMKSRYFDAASSRFIQADPIGLQGGPNLYAYVGNNPVGRLDPDGTKDEPPETQSQKASSEFANEGRYVYHPPRDDLSEEERNAYRYHPSWGYATAIWIGAVARTIGKKSKEFLPTTEVMANELMAAHERRLRKEAEAEAQKPPPTPEQLAEQQRRYQEKMKAFAPGTAFDD